MSEHRIDPTGSGTRIATVRDETAATLAAISGEQITHATAMLAEPGRRWFCSGQGRSGLVAQMTAMRLMHLGFDAHAVGEATAPSTGDGDGLLALSGSGETAVTVHLARLARDAGARILAVTAEGTSTLAGLAHTVVEIPARGSSQFGGTLFEQSALLVLDALILDLTARSPHAHTTMRARHTNLQ